MSKTNVTTPHVGLSSSVVPTILTLLSSGEDMYASKNRLAWAVCLNAQYSANERLPTRNLLHLLTNPSPFSSNQTWQYGTLPHVIPACTCCISTLRYNLLWL